MEMDKQKLEEAIELQKKKIAMYIKIAEQYKDEVSAKEIEELINNALDLLNELSQKLKKIK